MNNFYVDRSSKTIPVRRNVQISYGRCHILALILLTNTVKAFSATWGGYESTLKTLWLHLFLWYRARKKATDGKGETRFHQNLWRRSRDTLSTFENSGSPSATSLRTGLEPIYIYISIVFLTTILHSVEEQTGLTSESRGFCFSSANTSLLATQVPSCDPSRATNFGRV